MVVLARCEETHRSSIFWAPLHSSRVPSLFQPMSQKTARLPSMAVPGRSEGKSAYFQLLRRGLSRRLEPTGMPSLNLGDFGAVRPAGPGPDRRFAAVQRQVRNGGQTGRSADGARTGAFDPNLTLPTGNCRIAKGLFDLDVGCLRQCEIRGTEK
jgi:hypothetical protein